MHYSLVATSGPGKVTVVATSYRLYDANDRPVRTVRDATISKLDRFGDPKIKLWKTDNAGRITLNLSSVRRQHGRSYLKIAYKKIKTIQ